MSLWARYSRRVALFLIMTAAALFGQGEQTSTIQGMVLDAHNDRVSGASVQVKTGTATFSVHTDLEGRYRFAGLRPGSYSIHAEAAGGTAEFGPLVLAHQESRSVDLKLSSSEMPAYSDTPSFIVAGVSDGANRGGHGADPILHSAEALTKATASLGPVEEPGAELETVRAYERAAEGEPSETHFFDWGAELLTHRAAEQAAEVFGRGHRLFPRSTRMLLGLAVSWYSRGWFDQAERFFFEATDLNPGEPKPYLFLGQVRNSPIGQALGFVERMERFARLNPENAWANYYYAISLRGGGGAGKAQALLEKAVRLDPGLAAAWLQLGIVLADENDWPHAMEAWRSAVAGAKADATAIEAHYRLSQAYRRAGESEKAKAEIEMWEQMSKKSAAEEERERAAIREFVFTLRDR